MKTHKFARKPFYVDAVRVSEANIEEVAEWCEGEIKEDDQGKKYIHIKGVYRPLDQKQTMAYIGDWVLLAKTGFKVYIPKAFDKSFEKVKHLTKAQADEAGIKVPHEPSRRPEPAKPRVQAEQLTVKDDLELQGTENRVVPKPTPPPAKGDVKQPFEVKNELSEEEAQQKAADELIQEVLRHDQSRA